MTATNDFSNPHYREYARLLAELHQLIAQGQDESPQGEMLREQMDACGAHLSDDEIADLSRISADLHSHQQARGE